MTSTAKSTKKKPKQSPFPDKSVRPAVSPEVHLSKLDARLAGLIAKAGPFTVRPGELVRPFDALAESIAYQQLSGKAAATIWGRVRALYPRRKWLDPRLVLATPDEKFRAAGLPAARRPQSRISRPRQSMVPFQPRKRWLEWATKKSSRD